MQLYTKAGLGIWIEGNEAKPKGHTTGRHTHNVPHVTVISGRHRLILRAPVEEDGAPVLGPNGKPLMYVKQDREYLGRGAQSEWIIEVLAGEDHELIALEDGCGHACFFVPLEVVGMTQDEAAKYCIAAGWTGLVWKSE